MWPFVRLRGDIIKPPKACVRVFEMRALSLFSGIGGFDIAAEWCGFEVVGMVENDKFCQKVLKKHWPMGRNSRKTI